MFCSQCNTNFAQSHPIMKKVLFISFTFVVSLLSVQVAILLQTHFFKIFNELHPIQQKYTRKQICLLYSFPKAT